MVKAVILDFGHTIMREDSCLDPYLQNCPIDLMPGAREAIETIPLPKGIWANTRHPNETQENARNRRKLLIRQGQVYAWTNVATVMKNVIVRM